MTKEIKNYTPAEVAEILGVTPQAVYGYIRRKRLYAFKPEGEHRLFVPAEALKAWQTRDFEGMARLWNKQLTML